jgi:hypothetical protein
VRRALSFLLVALLACCGGRSNLSPPSPDDASTTNGTALDAGDNESVQSDGQLPACSWPTPVLPADAGPFVKVAADRTVLFCGVPAAGGPPVNYINPTICLSASATECTPVSFYDDAGGPPCVSQCSPCVMECAPNEYAIGVGIAQFEEGPPIPFPPIKLPTNCRNNAFGGDSPFKGLPEPLFQWTYACCPCQ